MKIRKIIILTILFIAVIGFTLAPASAASKTLKIVDSSYDQTSKYIGKTDYLFTYYNSKYSVQFEMKRAMEIGMYNSKGYGGRYHYITKIVVTYKGDGKYKTTTYKAKKGNKQFNISKQVPKPWKPVKVKIYYKTTKKALPKI